MEVKIHPEWYQYLQRPEQDWSLTDMALLVAEQLQPKLERQVYIHKLEDMAGNLIQRIDTAQSLQSKLDSLADYFANELGFNGNVQDYYSPDNSLLNKVIDTRTGIPITLSILFMRLAESIGLDMYGIGFPGHFLVGITVDDSKVVLDPFNRAEQLNTDKLLELLAKSSTAVENAQQIEDYLTPLANRFIIVRLLRNLKNIYIEKQEVMHALTVIEMILSIIPESPGELRDRGMVYHHMEYTQGALTDLQRFIELEPDSNERNVIEALIESLSEQTTSLH